MKAIFTLSILSFLLLGICDTQAQIFKSRSDIIEEYGTGYEADVATDGTKYIVYENEYDTRASGEYIQLKAIYFTELDDGTEICNMWRIMEPSTETNSTISYLKDNFVETGYMEFKDYENEILYNVEVDEGHCILTATFNNSK